MAHGFREMDFPGVGSRWRPAPHLASPDGEGGWVNLSAALLAQRRASSSSSDLSIPSQRACTTAIKVLRLASLSSFYWPPSGALLYPRVDFRSAPWALRTPSLWTADSLGHWWARRFASYQISQ